MNKKLLILVVLAVIMGAGIWFWGMQDAKNKQETQKESQVEVTASNMILFYGEECPHCKDLEKIIEELNIEEKVQFDTLEIWHSKQNSQLLIEKAEECGVAREAVGVPFFYGEGKCYIGTPEIEAYLKQKAGMN